MTAGQSRQVDPRDGCGAAAAEDAFVWGMREAHDSIASRHAEVASLLGDEGISDADTKALERVHPMFMSGNYLPGMDDGEVEIARIEIASTTFEVSSRP